MNDTKASDDKVARGAKEALRFFEENRFRHVFGLPGSSMVSVLYEMQNSSVQYVATIHESVAVAAADGYGRVAGYGLAMIYMVPGLANGLGNLYNAWRDESPLIVVASQQASYYRSREGSVGEGDTVSMARPFTRLAQEITGGMPVYAWLEAARRASRGTPAGPAFLSITEDAFEHEAPVVAIRQSEQAKGGAPDISRVVERLQGAQRPLLVVGGQLRRYGGAPYVEELAVRHEIPVVYEAAFNDQLGVAPGHSHCFGNIMAGGTTFERDADVVVLIGTRLVLEGHPREQPWFANASFVAQVNMDQAKLEESRTADWVAACDPAAFAKALLGELSEKLPARPLLQSRADRVAKARIPNPALANDPMMKAMAPYMAAVSQLHDAMDRGWVVDESIMASAMLVSALKAKDGTRYISTAGAAMGWGTGAAAGVALASGEPVTCVMGDGALRFGSQGLWTISAYKLPITLVILDNGGYGSTRHFEREYIRKLGDEATMKPSYLNMDFRELGPKVHDLISGYGIPCRTLKVGDNIRSAILEAWRQSSQGPNAIVISIGFES